MIGEKKSTLSIACIIRFLSDIWWPMLRYNHTINTEVGFTTCSNTHTHTHTHTHKEAYLESTVTEHSYDTQKYHCGQYSSGYDNSSSCHPTSSPSNSNTGTGSDIISKSLPLCNKHKVLSDHVKVGLTVNTNSICCNMFFCVVTEPTQKVIL